MNLHRGDIALAFYPFASGTGGSRRPVLILQSDIYNLRIRNTIVAQITSNLTRANDAAHLFIDLATADGSQSGLLHDSVVSCLNLATLTEDRFDKVIGHLSDALMAKANDCLKAAFALP
jgi:mRNA interferase MazF